MREVPFDQEPVAGDEFRVNLLERIQKEARSHTQGAEGEEASPPVPGEERKAAAEEKTPPGADGEPSATFSGDEPGDDFEDIAAEKLEELLTENPEELAELFIELGNVARIIWGPGIYEGLMFPGQERNDIRDVVRKSIANEKANKEPTDGFNNYERRLYEKWPKLQTATQNISFSDEQIKKLAKYLGQDIARVGVPEFINRHRWVIYWLALELGKAKEIIQGRATDAFSKKFGFE